jgi:5'-methylthioadenosine phosphorylase
LIGIIGGSGLEDPKLLKDFEERKVKTKFGEPSSAVTIGKINGVEVAILSRHGKKHNIMPTKVPFRANIWALKELGVKHLVVSTACGSLREEIEPGHLVFPSQLIDHT